MLAKSVANWTLFGATIIMALSSIYYFINITNKESEVLTASILNAQSPQKTLPMKTEEKISGAVLKTNYGTIEVAFAESAPNTSANFIRLAKSGFYDGTKFHRVIAGFMIQGGDPLSKDDSLKGNWGTGSPGYQFADELSGKETYPQGTLAMANSGPNTNGSQFFIVTANPEAMLPPSYTVFGHVTSGMNVALKIEKVKTEGKGVYDRPVDPVIIESVTLK